MQIACIWRVIVDIEGGEVGSGRPSWVQGESGVARVLNCRHCVCVCPERACLMCVCVAVPTAYFDNGALEDPRDAVSVYFASLYWSCMTITTVGCVHCFFVNSKGPHG
jgi:hypothetical protein